MSKFLIFIMSLISISKLFCGDIQENNNEKDFYLILSVHSPLKNPVHKILSDIPSDKLLLIAGAKMFSEEEQIELVPFFNSISRVENYRDSGKFELEVCDLFKKKPFKRIIIYHEYDLLRAAKLRDFFGLEGQNYASALAFRDKVLMKETLANAGIKVPSFMKVGSPIDVLEFIYKHGFPVVIKPIFGTGAKEHSLLKTMMTSIILY